MKLPQITNNTDLLIQINSSNLYTDVIHQLNKDFEVIGAAIDFSDSETPEDLFYFLQDVISTLLEKHFDLFLNLLYRVDIDETQIKTIINSMSDNTEQQIAFIILKREWLKVWFRKNY